MFRASIFLYLAKNDFMIIAFTVISDNCLASIFNCSLFEHLVYPMGSMVIALVASLSVR